MSEGDNPSDIELSTGEKDEQTFNAPDASNVDDALEGTPILGSGITTISDARSNFSDAEGLGDIASASGQLVADGASFAAECAIDITSFVMDPVNWLVSNGLDFLLNLIQPLQDALHAATGDGPSLGEASQNFVKISQGFVELAADFVETGDKALDEWNEDAGKAAKEALAEFAAGIEGVGSSAGSVAETLKMWSMVMTIIEETIKAIISELVSFLIYTWAPALAASIVSFGSSVAAAMSASIAKAASALSKVTAKMGKLGRLIDKFMDFLVKWSSKLQKSSEALTKPVQQVMRGGATKSAGRAAQWSATKEGAADILKETGSTLKGKAIKEVVGTDPSKIGEDLPNTVKGGIDAFEQMTEYADLADATDAGGNPDAETTEDNLRM